MIVRDGWTELQALPYSPRVRQRMTVAAAAAALTALVAAWNHWL